MPASQDARLVSETLRDGFRRLTTAVENLRKTNERLATALEGVNKNQNERNLDKFKEGDQNGKE